MPLNVCQSDNERHKKTGKHLIWMSEVVNCVVLMLSMVSCNIVGSLLYTHACQRTKVLDHKQEDKTMQLLSILEELKN